MTTTTDLDTLAIPRGNLVSQQTQVEQARAVAEVAAAVRVALEFPRDVSKALGQMRDACRQRSLADRAFFSLPRAGGRVEGSTVHLARELARCWGNIQYGVSELRRDDEAGVSEMQAWAWDVETNTRSMRSFIVPHDIMVGKGADKKRKRLVDLGDIANNNNSVAARAVRETIFTVLPVWFRTEAEELCSQTLRDGGGKTHDQQVADALGHFRDTFNVTQGQLEERLSRPVADWTSQDLGYLRVLAGELSRGEKRAADEFATTEPKLSPAAVTADDIPLPDPTTEDSWGTDS